MEIFSPLNQVVQGIGASRVSVHKPPDPTRINTGDEAARPEADPRHMSRNEANSELLRLAADSEDSPQAKDPDRPAGPPPSFDISVLERALDFQRTMALLEVEHSQARDIAAVRPETQPDSAPEPTGQGSDRSAASAAAARDMPAQQPAGQASPQNQAQAQYEGAKVTLPGVEPE